MTLPDGRRFGERMLRPELLQGTQGRYSGINGIMGEYAEWWKTSKGIRRADLWLEKKNVLVSEANAEGEVKVLSFAAAPNGSKMVVKNMRTGNTDSFIVGTRSRSNGNKGEKQRAANQAVLNGRAGDRLVVAIYPVPGAFYTQGMQVFMTRVPVAKKPFPAIGARTRANGRKTAAYHRASVLPEKLEAIRSDLVYVSPAFKEGGAGKGVAKVILSGLRKTGMDGRFLPNHRALRDQGAVSVGSTVIVRNERTGKTVEVDMGLRRRATGGIIIPIEAQRDDKLTVESYYPDSPTERRTVSFRVPGANTSATPAKRVDETPAYSVVLE